MNLLAIETSSEYLSLALACGDVVHVHHARAGQRHAELILDAISDLLGKAGIAVGDIHGIAYGEGPGSFTGLRIACGVVQGLALAGDLPVKGVGTLMAIAEQCESDRVLACIDARMGDVYHAAYCRSGNGWDVVQAPALSRPDDLPVPQGGGWRGAGSGFAAYEAVLRSRLGTALADVHPAIAPTAEAVLRLARPALERGQGAPADSAIPVYVRDKVALKTGER